MYDPVTSTIFPKRMGLERFPTKVIVMLNPIALPAISFSDNSPIKVWYTPFQPTAEKPKMKRIKNKGTKERSILSPKIRETKILGSGLQYCNL